MPHTTYFTTPVSCTYLLFSSSFFFTETATTEIYTLSLHDALPISPRSGPAREATPPYSRCAPTASWGIRCRTRCTARSEEHTSELQSHSDLVCRLLLEKKKSMSNTHLLDPSQLLENRVTLLGHRCP